jgi:uncharacterized damage-inducible protein DinB
MSNDVKGIQIQIKHLDQKKHLLMNLISSLSEEKYRTQPDPNTWSIGQIANHLYLSELLSTTYLRKKLSYPDTIPAFSIKSWWSLFWVKFILWTNFKVKAPPKINMWDNQEVLLPQELDIKWNQLRTELVEIILDHLPQFNSHLVYNHPFAGRMTMKQMLIFFNHHMYHHLRQAKQILRKIS